LQESVLSEVEPVRISKVSVSGHFFGVADVHVQ
jgi:hypothetical protein